ncbi:MAG: sugar nucleotide-binding protein [Acidobacteria bacterium]|nr:sugar nucleotide-binding protein [Acidobacteriota bacterium]NIM63741.1 sugar nucleotide-binding protein [Acidobacteriota bacterium]NIO59310.1 sugar nucleotide-binding protein [Acidobacteriota bacterium]NIQ30324.1 sugar nucleotide-binding protein [Acidobacteriota bacterium]NIQ85261.1 sugar nucleotide-binding protein [Acidobacteriota bacterium]
MSERILIVGATGQLGLALRRQLDLDQRSAVALGPHDLDLTAFDVGDRIAGLEPTAVINAAAWTDVRAAEQATNRQLVWEVNCHGPRRLAECCAELGVPLVHVSTDYVFDGQADQPYKEDAPTGPLQAYGMSKLDGEREVLRVYPESLIARTSTVYGDRPEGPPHYVDAILAQAREHGALEVVRPPVSSPSYTVDIAAGLIHLLDAQARGVVHVVNDGAASRLELAAEAVRLAGFDFEVGERAAPPDDLERPDYSVLDTSRYRELTGRSMRPWQDALRDYVCGLDG